MLLHLSLLVAPIAGLPWRNGPYGASSPPQQSPLRATEDVISLFDGYFKAKSAHSATGWLSYFDPKQTVYCDAILGECFDGYASWKAAVTGFIKPWPPYAPSEFLSVAGDTNSAVIHFVDTPFLFGAELRLMSAIDFEDGKIVRQVDYWDGRFSEGLATRLPRSEYPHDLGLSTVKETSAPELRWTVDNLQAALASGNGSAVATLFDYNAIYEDVTLRTRQEGQVQIGRYLQRTLSMLPYGPGAGVQHVMGLSTSGGYEWATNRTDVFNGITMIQVDGKSGLITLMRTLWDSSLVANATMDTLALQALEKSTYFL